SSAESLLTLINDILDFSKIEAGKLELEAIDFDVELMVSELGKAIAFQAHEKDLELILPANPIHHQWFNADPSRLRQILTNLLGNAIKFTERGEVAVYYSVQQQSESHALVRFDITDTGIGLSTEQQIGLFDRFSQADGSTTRKYGGTGLGLAISKQLVELMGGEIGVKSTPGNGSTFWFTLHLARAKSQPYEPVRSDLKTQKILIVDDNATNGRLLEQLLSDWQIDHQRVDNAAAALIALHSAANGGHPYTIAIIDRLMPIMDGLQLGRTIKADLSINTTRLLLLNTQGQRGDAKKFKGAGFDGYHSKPIEPSLLYSELLKVAQITPANIELATQHISRELPQFNARVLVVEDNATNQLVAKGMLAKFAVRIDVAGNGKEALAALAQIPYDLVFMDCQMPVMDGYEASRHIRDAHSQVKNQSVPIIAMTANAMQGDREQCLAAGMSDYIAKPIDPAKLQRALSEWLPARCQPRVTKELEPDCGSQAMAIKQEPVFDFPAFSARLMNDKNLIKIVVDAFLADIPVQIAQLRAALIAADLKQAAAQAHQIKGACANVGAMVLSDIAKTMEQARDIDTCWQAMPLLEQAFAALKIAMDEAQT
ncbi:MAG: response regulator, partial [Shewanella sp.]